MVQDRRTFLTSLGAAALAASCRSALAELVPGHSARPGKLGIQLYTVRRQAAADLAGTLAKIAATGLREVELEAYYRRPPAEWRDLLKRNNLTAPSSHVTVEEIETQTQRVFDESHTVGVEWLVARELPRGRPRTADDWKRVAARFNTVATTAKSGGFRFAFHNHVDIIRPIDGVRPIDILMPETDPSLVSFELDVYWATSGGSDPLELLKRYSTRFRMLHLKDGKPPYNDDSQTDLGQGTIDFPHILAAAGGMEHWFVESDEPKDPFAFAANAYQYVKSLSS